MKIPKIVYYVLLIISSLLVAFIPVPQGGGTGDTQTIDILASQFQFDPGMVRINTGDLVTIQLTSLDVAHGIYLDGYNLEVMADPGETRSFTFLADRIGSYRFRCSITCGALHPFMIGRIQVGPNQIFYRGVGFSALIVIAFLVRSKL